ncbi:hypothetical protein EV356DRAFT_485367 [Viridothelium virens]|uniref:Pyridoxal phosphate homeostasis protein n=1 Tax=Viridothelium virens TaxID=1048519 RepID=A0A6A6H9Z8_VIRVR|nr:hypothetical protein EV356DRAFT_485367 [Viridothelium virens]
MRVDPQRAAQLLENLHGVKQRIQGASGGRTGRRPVRLIAVSKLKPVTDILALHRPPSSASNLDSHFHFGENYAQELTEKASLLPHTINWHFIGALQSNKCKSLAQSIPNLYCVSSVDTIKKASLLNEGRRLLSSQKTADQQPHTTDEKQQANQPPSSTNGAEESTAEDAKLRILVQVNTSGEDSKSGVAPRDAANLIREIRASCPYLRVRGLMTIGAIARSQATTPETENEDFVALREVQDTVVRELGLEAKELELSMGMSGDFEGAIALGSDEVRVGTTIFGERPAKKDAKVKEDVEGEKG